MIGEILEIASFIAFLTMGSFIGLSAAAQSDGMGLRPILNPKVLDLSGNEIQDELIPIGGQVTVSIRYPNYKDEAQFSIVIIEIRDSEGVTIFLAWQSNTTPISGAAEVGVLDSSNVRGLPDKGVPDFKLDKSHKSGGHRNYENKGDRPFFC